MAGVDCPEPPAPGGGDCAALRVGGVDGVAGGWVMAVTGASPGDPVEGIHVWSSFGELWAHAQQWGLGAVAVDIPIGLPGEDGRTCDREARARLKGNPGRTSSVFPAPPYCVTEARNWEEASRLARDRTGKGLTRQSFALLPKIRDVRCAVESCNLNRSVLPWLVEVHPEVSFREMAGVPMRFHKSLQAGIAERLAVLQLDFSKYRRRRRAYPKGWTAPSGDRRSARCGGRRLDRPAAGVRPG